MASSRAVVKTERSAMRPDLPVRVSRTSSRKRSHFRFGRLAEAAYSGIQLPREQLATVDQQFSETRAQLGVKIEAVETKVTRVYDEVIAMREEARHR